MLAAFVSEVFFFVKSLAAKGDSHKSMERIEEKLDKMIERLERQTNE
nr:DUF4083 family protein [Geobacillus vulcani]